MRTICIFNHKGGVGKTTTAVNLAAGLSRQDRTVLLVDLDPQSNVGLSLQVHSEHNIYDAMTGKVNIKQCIFNLAKNIDVITSKENLTKAEFYLSNNGNTRLLLKELLSTISGYDFLIIDCPPSLGIVNQNVLAFCKEAFIPVAADFLGFDALKKIQPIVEEINRSYKHDLKVSLIVPTLFDRRNKICREMLENMKKLYPNQVAEPIHTNSKLKEAPKYGRSIFSYARNSPGAKDYQRLVEQTLELGTLRVTQEVVN